MLQNTKRELSQSQSHNPEDENTSKRRKPMEEKTNKTRLVKLYCPAVTERAELVARDEERIDLGNIARRFSLEPGTLKLNGYFISRGIDLIASCVTWKSLLSFFSSRGLGTGDLAFNALIVDGKLSKPRTSKRSHEPTEIEDTVHCVKEHKQGVGVGRIQHHIEIISPMKKKLKKSCNVNKDSQHAECSSMTWKRKHWLENTRLVKRAKVTGSYSDLVSQGYAEREMKEPCIIRLQCGYQLSENSKRTREEEVVAAASCKRVR